MIQRKRFIYGLLLISFLFYSFSIYTYSSKPNSILESKLAQDGKLVFQQNNCVACHQIYGLGGYIGPDLTNSYSTKGDKYMKVALRYGIGKMPKLNLSEHDIDALVEYLKFVDGTGVSPYRHIKLNYNGTVRQIEK